MTTIKNNQVKRSIGTTTSYATIGTALATVIAWLVLIFTGVEMPDAVRGALAVIIPVIGATVGGWLAPPSVQMDRIIVAPHDPDGESPDGESPDGDPLYHV